MRRILIFLIIIVGFISPKTNAQVITSEVPGTSNAIKNDTITIANKDLEYEVIIIDGGFSTWLNTRAFPRGHYPESYLENKNKFYVAEWNNRAMQPMRYNKGLYEMPINYDSGTHYGYEVNYLIYNYMIYFQNKYKQQLYGFVPPR